LHNFPAILNLCKQQQRAAADDDKEDWREFMSIAKIWVQLDNISSNFIVVRLCMHFIRDARVN